MSAAPATLLVAVLVALAVLVATWTPGRGRLAAVLPVTGPASGGDRLRSIAGRLRGRVRGARVADARRDAVTEVCTALAAELRAGRSPAEALRLAVTTLPESDRAPFLGALAAARRGGAVEGALRAAAGAPGAGGLRWLAACWEVGVESGAGLADAVERLTGTLRAEQASRREVAAQLAAPRATARMLAALPVVGLLMATGLGQDPVGFLLGTPSGLACLAVGAALDTAGLIWTARLARAAEPS